MSIFPSITRVTVNVQLPKGKEQGITLLVRNDPSVEQAVAYEARREQHADDNSELGIDLLMAYVEGWEVDGQESDVPWSEETLRKVTVSVFEALVTAVSKEISPAEDSEDSEDSRPNA